VTTPERRRRTTAVVVLLTSVWALLATSPPTPPTHTVESTSSVPLRLSGEAPITVVTFVVAASDEALWSDDREVIPQAATVNLTAFVPRPPAAKASSAPSTGVLPVLSVRILRDSQDPMLQPGPAEGAPSIAELNLLEACPRDLDCRLALQAVVEWLNPMAAAGQLSAELRIIASAQIQGPEVAPVGSEISLVVEEPATPEVTVLHDASAGAAVRLDAERPMVTWAFEVEANAAAMAQPLQWPIDPRAVLSLVAEVPGAEPGASRYGDPAVRLLLIGGGEEVELRPVVGTLQHRMPVFRCHVVGEACTEPYSLVAMWLGEAPDQAVTLGWSLDAGIAHHGGEPADGASVDVSEPSRTDIARDGPAIAARTSGTIALFDEDNPVRARTVHVQIPAGALDAEAVGGPVPAILAVVTASSTSSRPIESDTTVRLRAGSDEIGGEEHVPYPFEPPASWVVWGAPTCRAGAGCSGGVGLFGSAYRPGGGLEGSDLTIHWEIEVILLYPHGTSPPVDAEIMLTNGIP